MNDPLHAIGRRWRSPLVWTGLAVGLLWCSRYACAQHALGDGHALDANTSVTDGRYNLGRRPFLLNRINEAIVTGNVGGGFGFRGDLGYTAPDAFRGSLGSDDLYRFQRDSYRSGLPLSRARRDQATSSVAGLAAPLVFDAPGSGVDLAEISEWRYGRSRRAVDVYGTESRLGLTAPVDGRAEAPPPRPLDRSLSILDRSATVVSDPLLLPGPLWSTEDFDRRSVVDLMRELNELEMTEEADADDATAPTGETTSPPTRSPATGAPGESTAPKVRGSDFYLDILAELVARSSGDPLPPPGQPYSPELLERIERIEADARQAMFEEYGVSDAMDGAEPVNAAPVLAAPMPSLKTLTTSTKSRFDRLLRAGESALAEGRYFDAEQAFATASRFLVDSPMPRLGRLQAQLGAGLYLSASNSLERFLLEYPALTGVRYDTSLWTSDRADEVVNELRRAIERGSASTKPGLLLAYTGWQTRRDALVQEGLEAHERLNGDERLVSFLSSVWTDVDTTAEP
ncbi:MAG: hypothetical protein ACF8PN_00410 [Phycisphaerales bacterium]